MEKHKTFKNFIDSKRILDRSHFLKMIEGKKKYLRCFLKPGRNRLTAEYFYQRKQVFEMTVMIKQCVINVTCLLMKRKN